MESTGKDINERVAHVLAVILTGAILALLLSGIFMLVWNLVMPELTGIKQLSYPQALGIFILCKILFRDKLIQDDHHCSEYEEEEEEEPTNGNDKT